MSSANSVIGVWTAAYRQKVRVRDDGGDHFCTGPYVQVSRLGNPLVNEVLIPMGQKDYWNSQAPGGDSQFAPFYANPELAQLLPGALPRRVPEPGRLQRGAAGPNRADLVAILLTGIPPGLITGFQNFTGTTQADLLRLNMAIAPSTSPVNTGLIGGDIAGFPNGRRVFDDVVTIELRCLAGAVLKSRRPVVHPRRGRRRHQPGPHLESHRPHRHGHRELPVLVPVPRRPAFSRLRRGPAATLHGRATPRAPQRPRPAGASVVLDIGPHAGALVVYTGPELAGEEIEIRPHGEPWRGVHTAVRERHVDSGTVHAGVFDRLRAGRYDLRQGAGSERAQEMGVEVVAGSVTEATLPLSPARPSHVTR